MTITIRDATIITVALIFALCFAVPALLRSIRRRALIRRVMGGRWQ